MAANGTLRYRAHPTSAQANRLDDWMHTSRAIWNMALEQRRYVWDQRRYTLRATEQSAHLTIARNEMAWVADLPAQTAQQILKRLDRSFDNWWNPLHAGGRPKMKKRGYPMSLAFTQQSLKVEILNAKWARVWFMKLGWLKVRLSRPIVGTVRNATISRDNVGWHVSLGVQLDDRVAAPNGLPPCGVDFGVMVSAYVSDESEGRFMRPTLSPGEASRLVALERQKSRQLRWAKRHNGGEYSARHRRVLRKIAQLRSRQARRRLDFTHKLTTDLTKNHGWVAIEDLQVKNLVKSSKGTRSKPGKNVAQKSGLNRAILDNIPGERRRQLQYKAPIHGSELRVVPARFTSQRCAACGVIDPASRVGCGREFACTSCGHRDHADRNAAINIMKQAEGQPAVKHASTPVVRPRRVSRMRAAMVEVPSTKIHAPRGVEDANGHVTLDRVR